MNLEILAMVIKQELFELICVKFKEQKEKFNYLMENKEIIDLELSKGA